MTVKSLKTIPQNCKFPKLCDQRIIEFISLYKHSILSPFLIESSYIIQIGTIRLSLSNALK